MDQATGIGPERIAFDEEGYKVGLSRLMVMTTAGFIFAISVTAGDDRVHLRFIQTDGR